MASAARRIAPSTGNASSPALAFSANRPITPASRSPKRSTTLPSARSSVTTSSTRSTTTVPNTPAKVWSVREARLPARANSPSLGAAWFTR